MVKMVVMTVMKTVLMSAYTRNDDDTDNDTTKKSNNNERDKINDNMFQERKKK